MLHSLCLLLVLGLVVLAGLLDPGLVLGLHLVHAVLARFQLVEEPVVPCLVAYLVISLSIVGADGHSRVWNRLVGVDAGKLLFDRILGVLWLLEN